MSVITISRGCYSKGKEIAEKLAQRLGYECISREILLEASEHFNIPEMKLFRAIHDAPSILERFTYGKEKYIAYIRQAFLEHVAKDNVVYHGLAGHFFVKDIPHVLKVRIIANMQDRVREEMKREDISEERAWHLLKKDDQERRKWSLTLFGIDTWDANLYDMVLHIDGLTVDDAVDILYGVAQRPCFKATAESRRIIQDLVLAAKAQIALSNHFPTAQVSSAEGVVYVSIDTPLFLQVSKKVQNERKITEQAKDLLKDIEGIKKVRINVTPKRIPQGSSPGGEE